MTQILKPIHEVISELLKLNTLGLISEKSEMRVGALATLLGLLLESEIPVEFLPELIKSCEYVREAARIQSELPYIKYDGLLRSVNRTLKTLQERLPN